MKSAYLIGNITIKDENKWSLYRSKVSATLEPWNGELLLRGKKIQSLAGKTGHTDIVVIEFPNTDSLNSWFNSKSYQELIPIRNLAADMDLISYQSDI
jgi:uncharacterized protein (DUF1330 family)